MWVLLVAFFVLLGIYIAITSNYNYWKKRGVPHPPVSKLFGNLTEAVCVKKSVGQIFNDIYNDYPNLPYVGFYRIRNPGILIRDPQLLQNILIKDFSSFHDNDIKVDEKNDPIFAKNPFALKGDRWKVVRNQLITSFTTKKIKTVFPLVEEVGNELLKYLGESPEAVGKDGLETKELAAKFTTDVVASCAFGIDAKSFKDPKAEFREVGKMFLTPSFTFAIKQLIIFILPSLASIVKAKFFPDEVSNYFRKVVYHSLKYREENKIVRGDFLDLMKDFKTKLGEHEFNDEDIAAHAAGFFTDGFETSSFALSYALFELAVNLDVQTKLRNEIEATLAKDGKFTYENIQEISYLDNIIHETLRKYPPLPFLTRVCTKSFKLPSPLGNGKGAEVTIEPGTSIAISNYGIQHDSKYYPDPEQFDPDRFNEENRNSRVKCTYLSFGEGPRMCLGIRFGIMQVKVALTYVIHNFDVRLNKKTIVPLEIDPQYFLLKAKDNIWLNYYKRK